MWKLLKSLFGGGETPKPAYQQLFEYHLRVYLTPKACQIALQDALIGEISKRGGEVYLICFFEDSCTYWAARQTNAAIWVGMAADFATLMPAKATQWQAQPPMVIFAELHPLPSADERILEALALINPHTRVEVYLSMQDALLQRFGGERLVKILEMMGLEESEAIEHSSVNRSIHQARAKIAQKVSQDTSAPNAKQWFERNL